MSSETFAVPKITTGKKTTEFSTMQSSKTWSIIAMVLGLIISIGGAVASSLGADTNAAIILGAVVLISSQVSKTLAELGYIKSRAAVKTAQLAEATED